MKHHENASMESVTRLFCAPAVTEPEMRLMEEGALRGIFIGFSELLAVPYFLNFDSLINQHVFVFGMSGAGKTYLIKNIMLRLYAMLGSRMILIDFTGEYAEFAVFAGCDAIECRHADRLALSEGIAYFNLKGKTEAEKVSCAERILGVVARDMRTTNRRTFIILDEAWKILGKGAGLEVVVREGRKYSTGLLFASQLVEDVELESIANVATLFVFRMQNRESLERLARNYNLSEGDLLRIQNLGVGSCYVVQIRNSGERDAFVLRRVVGVELRKWIKLVFGEGMIEVDEEKIKVMLDRLCRSAAQSALSEIKMGGHVELHKMIGILMRHGAERRKVLHALMELGIDECELADAFAMAIDEMYDTEHA